MRAQQGNYTPLFQYADTLTWSKGKHTYKGGSMFRIGYARRAIETPTAPIPKAFRRRGLRTPNQKFSNKYRNARSGGQQPDALPIAFFTFLSGSLNLTQQY